MYGYSDYQNDLKQAKKLRDAARHLKNAQSKYNQSQSALKSCWKSEEFIPLDEKIQYWEVQMATYAKQLVNWADKIEREARRLYHTSKKKTVSRAVTSGLKGFNGGGGRF